MPVQTAIVNPVNLNKLALDNQMIPNEGTKSIAVPPMDFSVANVYTLDLEIPLQTGQISMVQCLFIDMSTSDQAMQIFVNGSNQVIVAKGRTQGYYAVLAPNPVKLAFSCPGGPGLDPTTGRFGISVQLVNVPIPGAIWPTL